MIRCFRLLALLLVFQCVAGVVQAASGRGVGMNYGPFLGYTVQGASSNDVVTKGVTVSLSEGTNRAHVLFDTETMRYAAAWRGGWLDLSRTHLTTEKGELPHRIAGTIEFTNRAGLACGTATLGDPRPTAMGALPRSWAVYKGLVRSGSNVVFRYSVSHTDVLDMPGLIESGGNAFFTRTMKVAEGTNALVFALREAGCDKLPPGVACPAVVLLQGSGVDIRLNNDGIEAVFAPRQQPVIAKFLFVGSEHGQSVPFDRLDSIHAPDLPDINAGGPLLWPEEITTVGRRGFEPGPFAVDTIAVPENNPWQSWMRLTGLDFFSDGRAAVTTWSGDVWMVSNIDDGLRAVKWKRFAAGLFDPLGLKIVRDEIYVTERSQITRLRDLNRDGEADSYENINNDAGVSPSYHAFAMDLQTDSKGNFYFGRAGQRVDPVYPMNGGIVRVSPDGSRAELVAHGLRVANGLGISPTDEIVCSDNQGNWMPSSRLNLIVPGDRFYGYVPHAHGLPTNTVPPLCWIPMSLDNSSGGQAFVTGKGWPESLRKGFVHTSYGAAALFHVFWETVDGVPQGGLVKFPLRFESGIMRPRFNPVDGQLYVAGLRGWQTKVARDAALQRVRYTGKPVRMPNALHVRGNGIELGFTDPLDKTAAEDVQNWHVEQWNYRWSESYGSDDYSVAEPGKKGRDAVEVRSVKLLPDGRSVFVEIPRLRPVMQMKIKFGLKTADGAPFRSEVHNTINVVPALTASLP